jgi:tRNA pseudouridine55 synthase
MSLYGLLNLNKPSGVTSRRAVDQVVRLVKPAKVGHAGTLDPLASGVLPIAIGEATKLAGRMLDSDKVYEFTIAFGVQTDTLDGEGVEIARSDARPTLADIEAVLPPFTGPIEQVPPAYSALKVDGQRAYDLARAGEEVVLASRPVVIHALSSSSTSPVELEELEDVTLTAHVSKGTYIRSLARDIAQALGTVGHVTMLRRIKAGPFTLADSISLDKLAELGHGRALEDKLLPLRAGLDDIPALSLTPDQAGLLRQGRVLIGIAADDGLRFAISDDVPVALVEVQDREVRVVRGFNL